MSNIHKITLLKTIISTGDCQADWCDLCPYNNRDIARCDFRLLITNNRGLSVNRLHGIPIPGWIAVAQAKRELIQLSEEELFEVLL